MRTSRLHAVLLLLAGSATVFGCASIFGLEELHDAVVVSEAGDAADASSQPDASDAAVKPETGVDCTHPGYPPPPSADSPDAGDGGDFSILVALNQIDFGLANPDDAGPALTGFNLDRICTVNPKTESCVSGANGTDFTDYVVDKGDAGVDNAGNSLIQYISDKGPAFKPENINARLRAGLYGVVIAVTAYNGQPDDTQVNVSFFPSFGIATDGGVAFAPSDVWRVDTSDIATSETSQWNDVHAYVAGGKLVAHVAHAPLKLTVDENNPLLTLTFDEAAMSADIVVDGAGSFRLSHGVVSGRVKTSKFLDSVQQLFYSPIGPNLFVCKNASFLGFITATVCSARDITDNSLNDNMKLPCDAFSAGAGFDTYAVDKWVPGTAPVPANAGCPPVVDCK